MAVIEQSVSDFISHLSLSHAKKGCDAYYFHIPGTKWGVKFFSSITQRNINYNRQAEVLRYKLAPELGDMVDAVIDGEQYYGFITEHVRVFMSEVLKHHGLPDKDSTQGMSINTYERWEAVTSLEEGVPPEWEGKYDELCNQLDTLPRTLRMDLHYDLHDFNWGINEHGEPLMIDFSRMGRDDDFTTS